LYVVVVVVVVNWRVGLRNALVSLRSERSSVTPLVNRASSSSLVFNIRLRRLLTLSTAKSQVSGNGPRIYIFFKRERKAAAKVILTPFFHTVDDLFCSAKLRLYE